LILMVVVNLQQLKYIILTGNVMIIPEIQKKKLLRDMLLSGAMLDPETFRWMRGVFGDPKPRINPLFSGNGLCGIDGMEFVKLQGEFDWQS